MASLGLRFFQAILLIAFLAGREGIQSPPPPSPSSLPMRQEASGSFSVSPRFQTAACSPTLPNTSYRREWNYQNPKGTLLTQLPPGGKVIFWAGHREPDGSFRMKWGFYRRGITGELRIEGRRLDGSAPPLQARIPCCYSMSGFQPAGLIFPTEGCWEVTARVGLEKLTFTILVRAVPFPEPRPTWLPPSLVQWGLRPVDVEIPVRSKSVAVLYEAPRRGWLRIQIEERKEEGKLSGYPKWAIQALTVRGARGWCIQGGWKASGRWHSGKDEQLLIWESAHFGYRIHQHGLGLNCAALREIARSLQTAP